LVDALRLGKYLATRNVAAARLIRLGNALLTEDPTRSHKAFAEALEHEPDNPLAYAGRGDAFRLQAQFAQAVAAYSDALRLDPRAPAVFNSRGLMWHRQGEHDKAIADFSAALRLEPRFALAYHNRGAAFYAKDDLDRAIADYTEAIRLDPKSALTFNNRGYAFFDKEDYDQALSDFIDAIRSIRILPSPSARAAGCSSERPGWTSPSRISRRRSTSIRSLPGRI